MFYFFFAHRCERPDGAWQRALEAVAATALGKMCAALMRPHWDDEELVSIWARADIFRGGILGVNEHLLFRLHTFGR